MRTRTARTRALAALFVIGATVAAAPNFTEATARAVDIGSAVPTSTPAVTAAAPPGGVPQGPFCSSIPPEGEGSFVGMADDPVATAASNNPYLTTLTAAIAAAGLVDTLNGEGPFTVFAPSNEAFAAIPQADLDAILADADQLTNILSYHVVSGRLSMADLATAGSVTSLQGAELTFTTEAGGSLSINGGAAMLTCADVTTANATVHVVDHVLTPPVPQLVDSL